MSAGCSDLRRFNVIQLLSHVALLRSARLPEARGSAIASLLFAILMELRRRMAICSALFFVGRLFGNFLQAQTAQWLDEVRR